MANRDSVNQVFLVGNLGRDPETKYTQSGTAVTNFSIATSKSYKRGDDWEQKTEWHNIVAWKDLAEQCNDTLHKGDRALVVGSIEYQTWEDKEGEKKYKTVINATSVMRVEKTKGGKDENGTDDHSDSSNRRSGSRSGRGASASSKSREASSQEITDDDIPF